MSGFLSLLSFPDAADSTRATLPGRAQRIGVAALGLERSATFRGGRVRGQRKNVEPRGAARHG
jgi:hypothetical protein